MSVRALESSELSLGQVHIQERILRKDWEGPQLSPPAELQAWEVQEVKAKAELETSWLRVDGVPQTYIEPLGKD